MSESDDMQDLRPKDRSDGAVEGLRVLALPVSALPLKPLLEARTRWRWHVDLLVRGKHKSMYEKLVAPSGRSFTVPSIDRQSWEDDAHETARVDQLIREVECATGIPTGQVVLAGGASIGKCFAEPIIDLMTDFSLPSLPAKSDNLEPYRIVRRAFRFADQMLETTRPDLIYCFELASLWSFVVWLIAQSRGIRCVILRRSKIRSEHCFLTTDRHMFNVAARELAVAKRKSSACVSDRAIQIIRDFRDHPRMVSYIRTKWDRRRGQSRWWTWHAQWARSVASLARPSEAKRLKQAGRSLVEFNKRFYNAGRQQKFLTTFDAGELAMMRYILFPVHKETDLSVYFQAAPWFDQRSTIRLLASLLPHGCRLLVREHPDNHGLRPSRYYRELLGLPNVILIDPFDSQFKYIANADLLVTENGSSGWEALLLKRKVIALSTTFYDGAGLARKVEKPADLGKVIVDMISKPVPVESGEYDRDLGRMIDAEYETTFPLRDTEATLDHLEALIRRRALQ